MTVIEPSVGKGTSYFLVAQGVWLCITVFSLHSFVFCVDRFYKEKVKCETV